MRIAIRDSYIDWDPATSQLSGPAANDVVEWLDGIVDDGGLVTDPYPTYYVINNPYTDKAEMGLALGVLLGAVPPELQEAVAQLQASLPATPEGEVS